MDASNFRLLDLSSLSNLLQGAAFLVSLTDDPFLLRLGADLIFLAT